MLNEGEYLAMKARDTNVAEDIVSQIKSSTNPAVKYKDSRPITDLKHMIETSTRKYSDHIAFYQKFKRDGEYEKITYQEMLNMVNGLGTALIDAGMKGKRIGIIGDNSSQWAVSYLAVVCGTGIAVPLDKELPPVKLQRLLKEAEVSCVIFSGRFRETFRHIKESGETKLTVLIDIDAEGGIEDAVTWNPEEVIAWNPLVRKGIELMKDGDRHFLDAQIDKDKMAVLLFTSGTTGVSKGVMLSHWNIAFNLMVAPAVLAVHDWDIFFSVLPLHHIYECTCGFLVPLYKGAAIAYCEGLKHMTENLKEVKPTMLLGMPPIFEDLYEKIWEKVQTQGKESLLKFIIKVNRITKKIHIDLGNLFFKDIRAVFGGKMRMMICGGAAIDPTILEGFQDFGIRAVQGYGLTECAPLGTLNPDTAPKAASIGIAFPACEIKIHEPKEEGIGEICLKGDNIMLGYYQMPEATAEVMEDGWFHTGDLGYIDGAGYVYITGRKEDSMVAKNEETVDPEEEDTAKEIMPCEKGNREEQSE